MNIGEIARKSKELGPGISLHPTKKWPKVGLCPSLRRIIVAIIVLEIFLFRTWLNRNWWGVVEWEEIGVLRIWMNNKTKVWLAIEMIRSRNIIITLVFLNCDTLTVVEINVKIGEGWGVRVNVHYKHGVSCARTIHKCFFCAIYNLHSLQKPKPS